jgi:hypothetical protein
MARRCLQRLGSGDDRGKSGKGLRSTEQEAEGVHAEVVTSGNGEQLHEAIGAGYYGFRVGEPKKTTKRITLVVANVRATTDCLGNTRYLPQL